MLIFAEFRIDPHKLTGTPQMKSPYRYIIYLLIGMALYYVLKQEKGDEQVLSEVHDVAPYIILFVLILLIVVKVIRSKRGE